ncbi:type IV secretion protein Rhs [Erwinia psidii]|uniref:RHS repeat-associated core domain-containing protein n=1 Tax=Erwinia psidii TaxID=69224 RepID=UPI00226B0A36|nr:RHS repeat-associated core domain-containing protein [Erwinia psidii]MCX8964238.1 type IV secretion protein Rhs [Erwinia psidii]
MSSLTAAREHDVLVHSSPLADFVSGLVEGAIYGGILLGAGMIASTGVGIAVGVALTVGAMASGLPEKLGNMAGEAVDGLLDTLGMRGPPDAFISSGSDDVHITGKRAARAAGIVDAAWLNSPAAEEEPGFVDTAMAMAAGIASAVSHPGATASAFVNKVSQIDGDAVKHFFTGVWDDLVQPMVASASPHATPADKDTVACSKGHMAENVNFLAEGSKKVLINGHPAVRNGDRSTCEATVQVSDNPRVNIGGDAIVVRDIRSGKNALAYFVGGLVGGLLGGGAAKQGAKLVEQLFTRIASRRALKQIACSLGAAVGSEVAGGIAAAAVQSAFPVHYATGAKFLAGEEELDFVLEDRIPLHWQRIYHSRNLTCGLLGTGWMMPFETRLIRIPAENGDTQFLWRDLSGQALGLGEIAPGDVVRFDEEGFTLYFTLQGVMIMQTAAGEFHLYEADPTREGEWRIARIYDRHENCQHFDWNGAGQLIGIAGDNEALSVRLSYEPLHGRLAAVHQVVAGELRLLVRYGYTPQGQLTVVYDADGVETRRFSWDRASDLMASHGYASGLSVEYTWQPSVDPRHWRVTEYRVLDGQRDCLEHWIIDADEQSRRATVTCLSGGSSQHGWDALGRTTSYTDIYGAHWSYRWAEQADLLMAIHAPGDRVWEYGYDERGRLTMVRDPAGRSTLTTWHPSYAFPLKEVLADGAVWEYRYNAAGDVVEVVDPSGGTTRFTWNMQGDLVTRTDALENVHRFWWNERGQLRRDEDCSGHHSHRLYDEAGRLSASTDAEGNTTGYQWSGAGRLRGVTRADGRETRYEYNRAGMLTGEHTEGFSGRRVTHNARGQIVTEHDAAGHLTRWQYDRFGRLTALINPNNERWQFEYDSGMRLLAQIDYAGRRKSYRYDAQGLVAEVTQYPLQQAGEHLVPETYRFEYDVVHRVISRTTRLTRTGYHYHTDRVDISRVSLAGGEESGEAEVISLTRDALGNLLREENEGGVFVHQYDVLGNLSGSTLPDGGTVNCLRYGTGHLLQVNLHRDGRQHEITGYQRDRLHREVGRTQGGLSQQTRYDPAGRVVMRRSGVDERSGRVFERRYSWDRLDRVMQERMLDGATGHNDWAQQQRRCGYDAAGRITHEVRSLREEHFSWDAAGNQTGSAGEVVWHNLLQRLKGVRWSFDGFGRMAWRKSGAGAVEQRFSYDDEHRITAVDFAGHPEFSRVEYRYDALGRRTRKLLHRHGGEVSTVTFQWSGLRMVGERSSETPERSSQYLYSEGGWEPLARVDSIGGESEVFWYHTELNGLPERLTDERGEVVWRGRFSTWGETERETVTGFHSVPQNLRFQGQYLDRETGLHYNLFRYYDPLAGRYTQPDPIGLAGGLNTYAYVDDPLVWFDPLGLKPCPVREVNGTRIHGTGQKDKTPGHNQFSEVIANKLAMSGKFSDIYLNRSYNYGVGSGISRRRPDVMAIDVNGRVHSIELASISDMKGKLPELTSRNETAMRSIPVTKQGEILVFEHPYDASDMKSILDDLISGI